MSWTRVIARRRRTAGRSADRATATALLLLALATLHMSPLDADAWGFGGIAISLTMSGLLTLVRVRPVPCVVVIAGLFLLAQATYGLLPVLAMIVIVAVFLTASAGLTPRLTTAGVAVVVAVLIDASAELTRHDTWTNSAYLVMATAALGAAAAGDAVRSRRAYLHEVEDRADRAEQAREQVVQRRVAEERLSIARDVHDLVAHHLAVISVQAEVANHLLDSQPVVAKDALRQVRGAAGSALDELGTVLGVLRYGDHRSPQPVEPAPTLGELPTLCRTFDSAGLAITRTQDGPSRPLPPALELAAYRLVQESLTNAHKHGTGAVDLHIAYDPGELVIDVRNAVAVNTSDGAGASPGGHGLLGMRERVAAVSGTLTVEHVPRSHFHVRARLPLAPVAAGRT